jgi:hypothetical protein
VLESKAASEAEGWLDEELDGEALEISGDGDEYEVRFKAPTDEQLTMRDQLVPLLGLENLKGVSAEDAAEVYRTAGPLWLHAYDRDHVLTLDRGIRTQMVKDVQITSVEAAQDLGRDILKINEAETAGQISLEEQKRNAGL